MDCEVDEFNHAYRWTLCESVSGSSVFASIDQDILQSYVGDGRVDWRMRLQRWESVAPGQPHGGYVTIGTRTGYVSPSSPSNREFTEVRSTGRPLQLAVEYYDHDGSVMYRQYNSGFYV